LGAAPESASPLQRHLETGRGARRDSLDRHVQRAGKLEERKRPAITVFRGHVNPVIFEEWDCAERGRADRRACAKAAISLEAGAASECGRDVAARSVSRRHRPPPWGQRQPSIPLAKALSRRTARPDGDALGAFLVHGRRDEGSWIHRRFSDKGERI
jgi:hypothetical protein